MTVLLAVGSSETRAAIPLAVEGWQPFVEVEVKVHIWSNVVNDLDQEGKNVQFTEEERGAIERDFPIEPASDLARLRRELESAAMFYFINSRFHFLPRLTFEVHDGLALRSEIDSGDSPYITPRVAVYADERDLGAPEHFDGLIHVERLYSYDRRSGQFTRVRGGGGFTLGVDDEMNTAGMSWFAMTEADHPSSNHWLFTHEFHHQLDRMFELSGHPEYWFNHFSPTEGTDGAFGEHYDGNAWILRNWSDEEWFDLKFGQVRYFKDADDDGVPDEDPALPFDEKRFGSSPSCWDSDGDGLDDLAELLLVQWAIPGLGEKYAASFHWPAPQNPDADGDRLSDGEDPLPLYAVSDLVPSRLSLGRWTLTATTPPVAATLRLSYEDSAFHIDVLATEAVELKVMVDAGGNGWWTGKDNIWVRTDSHGEIDRQFVLNCTVPDKWPFEDASMLTDGSLTAEYSLRDGYHVYSIVLYRDQEIGLALDPGQKLGLNIGYRLPGETFYTSFFEPNVLKWFRLGPSIPNSTVL